jgi:mono/diheme cytochrome c family protein
MGVCTIRSSHGLLAAAIVLGLGPAASAQSPTYGVGRPPTAEEVRKLDIAIGFEGTELPAGSGTAKQGDALFRQKCASCHGRDGEGGRAPTVIVAKGAPLRGGRAPGADFGIQNPGLMAAMAPNATILWDYINRAMPIGREGSLTPDEVYAATAYLLFKYNELVKEDEVLTKENLVKVKMPNPIKWVPPHPEHDPKAPRLKGYMQAPQSSR